MTEKKKTTGKKDAKSNEKTSEVKTMADKKDDNLMAAISYLLGFITGLGVYMVYKDKGNKFVLFHAMQSTITSIASILVMIPVVIVVLVVGIFMPGLGCILDLLIIIPVAIVLLVLVLFLMYKAYNGEKFKLPAIGDMAEKYSA